MNLWIWYNNSDKASWKNRRRSKVWHMPPYITHWLQKHVIRI